MSWNLPVTINVGIESLCVYYYCKIRFTPLLRLLFTSFVYIAITVQFELPYVSVATRVVRCIYNKNISLHTA